jgi:hypothetical protein
MTLDERSHLRRHTWAPQTIPQPRRAQSDAVRRPAQYTLVPVGTLWASVSFLIGPATISVQIFANVLSDWAIVQETPFGGDLSARMMF